MNEVEEYIRTAQQRGTLPGIVLASQYGYAPVEVVAWGVDGAGNALHEHSIFPVASITKLALALLVHRLVELGAIALNDSLDMHIKEIHPDAANRTIRSLLAHTSGYGFDLPNKEGRYGHGLTWTVLAQECLTTPPEVASGVRVQYSNLGYGILGVLVERVTNRSCADALHEYVLQPLGVRAWLGAPESMNVAVIGDVRGKHKGTDLETYNSSFWRALSLPWGGLFTDALGAIHLVQAFSDQSDFLSPVQRHEATSDHTNALHGGFMKPLMWSVSPWGLGPELRGHKFPHWVSSTYSPQSFGHSGASGMLVWHDPECMLSFAMLGARSADGGWLLRHAPEISQRLRKAYM